MGSGNTKEKKHLVIVGGSFAGVNLIMKLKDEFKITLIDKKDYFEWICGLPQSYIGNKDYFDKKATADFHQMVEVDKVFGNNVTFLQGMLSELVNENLIKVKKTKGVKRDQIEGIQEEEIHFDFLALCTGGIYRMNEDADSAKLVFSKKERQTMLNSYREDIEKASSVLVVGGGATGVETVGELLMNHGNKKRVAIITNADSLLAGYPNNAGRIAEAHFAKKDVKVYKKTRYDPAKKLEEDYDYVISCVGLYFHSEFLNKNFQSFKNERGQIYVNKYYQVTNINPCELEKNEHVPNEKILNNIFCYGDAALTRMNEAKNVPAIREGSYVVAHNIKQLEKESPKLKEMPYAVNMISAVYYDKWSGSLTTNKCSFFNCCIFNNKKAFEGFYFCLMKNKACGKCNWSNYNCQLNYMGCCLSLMCCGCSNREQKKQRREELKQIFGEEK